MARVKRGVQAKARHKKVLKQAKGYRGARSRTYKVAKQAVMIKDSPRWSDNIFSKIDKTKLENMYANMNKLAKDYKFLAGMMGRSTFTIPPSLFVKKVLDYKLMSSTMRDALAQSETAFKEVMTGLGYTRNKKVSVRRKVGNKWKWENRRETAKEFESNMDRFDKAERLEILNDVFRPF